MGYKGKKSSLWIPIDTFSISIILAVSEQHIYGIIWNESSNDAKVFCYFLSKVCQVVLNMIGDRIFKWIYWMDNSSIHKTLAVKEFWENSKISVVTIPPYWPSLNAAETVIHSIKNKLKSLVGGGRWVLIINSNIYL